MDSSHAQTNAMLAPQWKWHNDHFQLVNVHPAAAMVCVWFVCYEMLSTRSLPFNKKQKEMTKKKLQLNNGCHFWQIRNDNVQFGTTLSELVLHVICVLHLSVLMKVCDLGRCLCVYCQHQLVLQYSLDLGHQLGGGSYRIPFCLTLHQVQKPGGNKR